jgi:predicted Zn-dependent protease with MMP-like domain
LDRKGFEAVIAEALDGLPLEFAELMSNVSIQTREKPDSETLRSLDLDPRHHTLFGLYTGVPLDERGGWYGNVLPDVIVLYRRPLLDACPTRTELIRQIQLTLLHEIGHHFGLSDDEMNAWEREFGGLDEEDDETITN